MKSSPPLAQAPVIRRSSEIVRTPCPKPGRGQTIKAVNAKAHRVESKVKGLVRAHVSARDGDCRLAGVTSCWGESEWAHLEESRRSKTRGQAPELRHTVQGSAKLCTGHHRAYDAHQIVILNIGPKGAEGRITWDVPGYGVYSEPAQAG